jgi:hypothetical protein
MVIEKRRRHMPLNRLIRTASFALAFGLVMTGAAAAQDATPEPAIADAPPDGYPVAVHEGICAEPAAEAAFEIDNAVQVAAANQEDDDVEIVGTAQGPIVFQASSTLDVTLDDLGETDHVIAVHASDEDFGDVIACGYLAGVEQDGRVTVALAPVGDSTVSGIALVETEETGILDLGDEQVQVTVYIFDSEIGEDDMATPAD